MYDTGSGNVLKETFTSRRNSVVTTRSQKVPTNLFMRTFFEKNTKLGDDFSTGLMVNFLSSKLMCRISDHVKVVLGVSLFSFS